MVWIKVHLVIHNVFIVVVVIFLRFFLTLYLYFSLLLLKHRLKFIVCLFLVYSFASMVPVAVSGVPAGHE